MREDAETKGKRYLTEGRVVIVNVTGPDITANVRGDGAIHIVTHSRRQAWRCSCPARGRCAHLVATRLVTVA